MPPPDSVNLGPLTASLLASSTWSRKSVYPANQSWADDTERVLEFLTRHQKLDEFLPRLRTREYEGAFAEARLAMFLATRPNWRILDWEPKVTTHPGDLEVEFAQTGSIFVEVKGPGWEAELTNEEVQRGRTRVPKWIHAEARSVDPIPEVQAALVKALPKLSIERSNLVSIVDDFFLSPLEIPRNLLEYRMANVFDRPEMALVGAVLFLYTVAVSEHAVMYRHYPVVNKSALRPLPAEAVDDLAADKFIDPADEPHEAPIDTLLP
jgi:hypothetical protein